MMLSEICTVPVADEVSSGPMIDWRTMMAMLLSPMTCRLGSSARGGNGGGPGGEEGGSGGELGAGVTEVPGTRVQCASTSCDESTQLVSCNLAAIHTPSSVSSESAPDRVTVTGVVDGATRTGRVGPLRAARICRCTLSGSASDAPSA